MRLTSRTGTVRAGEVDTAVAVRRLDEAGGLRRVGGCELVASLRRELGIGSRVSACQLNVSFS